MASGGQLQKLVLVVVAVVALALGGVAAATRAQLMQLKQQLTAKQQQIASLTATNNELQQQLGSLEAERKGLEERLTELRTQLTSATGERERLRGSLADLQARYDALQHDTTTLEAQVSRLTRERDDAKDRIQRLEAERADVERTATRIRERFALLDRDYQQLAEKLARLEEQGRQTPPPTPPPNPSPMGTSSLNSSSAVPKSGQAVELPPIVVRKDQSGVGLPTRGRLIEINENHRFVVLDKGSNDGVRIGMTFDILRGGTMVAQAVAVRVRSQLSACDLIASRSPGIPQAGDLAIQHGP